MCDKILNKLIIIFTRVHNVDSVVFFYFCYDFTTTNIFFMITLFDFTFDISKKRLVFNGKVVREKSRLIFLFRWLLDRAGYSFHPYLRPVPAWLNNWKDMDYSYLYTAFKNIISQLDYLLTNKVPLKLGSESYFSNDPNFLVLEHDGFHLFSLNKDNNKFDYGRVCFLTFYCSERGVSSIFTTLDRLSYHIDLFLKQPLSNKQITIC